MTSESLTLTVTQSSAREPYFDGDGTFFGLLTEAEAMALAENETAFLGTAEG